MRRCSLFLAAWVLSGAVSPAQMITPAPVDLSGKATPSYGAVQGAIGAGGEFFLWNPGNDVFNLDGFTVACEAGCLDPTAHVAISAQAFSNKGFVDIYGAGSYSMDQVPNGSSDPKQISNLNLASSVKMPAGSEWAISLGKIVTGTLAQVSSWIAGGKLSLTYSGNGKVDQGAIELTDFVSNVKPPVVDPPVVDPPVVDPPIVTPPPYKPGPVDLADAPEISAEAPTLQPYVDAAGELFIWNASDEPIAFDGFIFACSIDCLNPAGHVDLATQAVANPDLASDAMYGAGIYGMGAANPTESKISNLNLSSELVFPPGIENALSLGRIFNGAPDQIAGWIDDGVLTFQYSSSGEVYYGAFQVIPEPSALVVALGFVALSAALQLRRRAFAT